MNKYKVEMRYGQDIRIIEADSYNGGDAFGWMTFFRKGREYWRCRLDSIVSMETKHNGDDN